MTNDTPETPSQANSGDSGLSDCENATRPHENPPYGQVLAIASLAVQMPATAAGSSSRRPATPPQTRGSHR